MLVRFKVNYIEDNYTEEKDEGLIACTDYNDFYNKLCAYYGKDNIFEFTAIELEDTLSKNELLEEFNR